MINPAIVPLKLILCCLAHALIIRMNIINNCDAIIIIGTRDFGSNSPFYVWYENTKYDFVNELWYVYFLLVFLIKLE